MEGDAESGEFRDTVVWVDSAGSSRGRRTAEGSWKGGVGGYADKVERADGRKVELSVTETAGPAGEWEMMRVAGGNSAQWTEREDTLWMERSFGKVEVRFKMLRDETGANALRLQGMLGGERIMDGAIDYSPEGRRTGNQ